MYYGWYVVAACLVISLYTSGFVQLGFTAVIEPLAYETGWTYSVISLAASLRGLETGVLSPVVGVLVDRNGPRRLVVAGTLVMFAGCLLLSRTYTVGSFYASFVLLSIGMSTCTHTVLITAVSSWFQKNLGTATGIAATGVGLGGLLIPAVTILVDLFDWRTAVFLIGIGMVAIVLPLAFVVRRKPLDVDGKACADGPGSKGWTVENMTASEAVWHRAFWHLAICAVLFVFMVFAVTTHIMPYLSTLGVSRPVASTVAAAIPISSIIGRLASGWLCDRFDRRTVMFVSFIAMGLATLLITLSASLLLIIVFVVAFGAGWGSVATTRMLLQIECFGKASFGTVLGLLGGVMMLGSISGPIVAGWIFDTWGSYESAWLICTGCGFVGAFIAFSTPRPRRMRSFSAPAPT